MTSAILRFQRYILLDKYTLVRYHLNVRELWVYQKYRKLYLCPVLKLEMYILNKMKLNKLGIPHYGKKLNDSIVHSNGTTYSKLHVAIVRNIINILICE